MLCVGFSKSIGTPLGRYGQGRGAHGGGAAGRRVDPPARLPHPSRGLTPKAVRLTPPPRVYPPVRSIVLTEERDGQFGVTSFHLGPDESDNRAREVDALTEKGTPPAARRWADPMARPTHRNAFPCHLGM